MDCAVSICVVFAKTELSLEVGTCGKNTTLTCSGSDTFTWYIQKENNIIAGASGQLDVTKYSVIVSSTSVKLTIHNTDISDIGIYACEVAYNGRSDAVQLQFDSTVNDLRQVVLSTDKLYPMFKDFQVSVFQRKSNVGVQLNAKTSSNYPGYFTCWWASDDEVLPGEYTYVAIVTTLTPPRTFTGSFVIGDFPVILPEAYEYSYTANNEMHFYVKNLSSGNQNDIWTCETALKNGQIITSNQIQIDIKGKPNAPRDVSVFQSNNSLVIIFVKGGSGGYMQTFVLEGKLHGNDTWSILKTVKDNLISPVLQIIVDNVQSNKMYDGRVYSYNVIPASFAVSQSGVLAGSVVASFTLGTIAGLLVSCVFISCRTRTPVGKLIGRLGQKQTATEHSRKGLSAKAGTIYEIPSITEPGLMEPNKTTASVPDQYEHLEMCSGNTEQAYEQLSGPKNIYGNVLSA